MGSGGLERQSHLPEQAFADFSTFELKCAILLGLPAHLRLLAATLGRLLQQPLFVEWLSAGSASPFRQPERDDPITGDVSLEKRRGFSGIHRQPVRIATAGYSVTDGQWPAAIC